MHLQMIQSLSCFTLTRMPYLTNGCRGKKCIMRNRNRLFIGVVVIDIAIGAGGLGFDSRAAQIGRNVANVAPPLRGFFGAVLPRAVSRATEMASITSYTLRRNSLPRV